MRNRIRKTATKIRGGRVQRKNRTSMTPNNYGGSGVAIERARPGRGFRHVLRQDEVFDFVRLVPGWEKLSLRLNRIILDTGSEYRFGWYHQGVIGLCAIESDLVVGLGESSFLRDVEFFEQLNVDFDFRGTERPDESDDDEEHHYRGCDAVCRFNRSQARCFHLVRTLLHELGHHMDWISNPRHRCTRGEDFAEQRGRELERLLWDSYLHHFGKPE